ncbi:unnamed protein product [Amoebophrya sp. A25]|nr:unnamed protein product [Amoebophrya sp. A25]|eukprot:GSA25T00019997001.1
MSVSPETAGTMSEQETQELAAPAEREESPIGLLGAQIDLVSLKIGRAYGRFAVQFPLACVCFGLLLPLLLAIPLFVAIGDGRRGPTQVGKGFVFRGDYGVFSPYDSEVKKQYDEIKRTITAGRISYRQAVGTETYKGKHYGVKAHEAGCKDSIETGQSDGDQIAFLFQLRDPKEAATVTDQGLCSTSRLDAIWQFEQYMRNRKTTTGKSWTPDFCPVNRKMRYKSTSEYHRTPCGDFKGQDVGNPACKTSGNLFVNPVTMAQGCQCAAGPAACSTNHNGYGERPHPYCVALLSSGCFDLTTEADGAQTSQAACVSNAVVGVPTDQMNTEYWCSPYSFASTIGLTDPVLDQVSATPNNRRYWQAMLDYSANPLNEISDGPSRMTMANLPITSYMSGFMGSQLMAVSHTDNRPAAVQADCTDPNTTPDAAGTAYACPVEPLATMISTRQALGVRRALDESKNGINAQRKIEQEQRKSSSTSVERQRVSSSSSSSSSSGTKKTLRKLMEEKQDEVLAEEALRRYLSTYTYGNCTDDNTALLAIPGLPAGVTSCDDVTAAMCSVRSYSRCDQIGQACKAKCASFDASHCLQLEPASQIGRQDEPYCASFAGNMALANGCLTTANTTTECKTSCLALGCQYLTHQTYLDMLSNRYDLSAGAVYAATGGNLASAMAAAGAGKKLPGCHACADDNEAFSANSVARIPSCHQTPTVSCKCGADLGGCVIKPDFLSQMGASLCPQACSSHVESCANPANHAFREALDTSFATATLAGQAAVAGFHTKCQGCLGYLAADAKFRPYKISQCKTFLALIRLRPECSLNHPDYARMANGKAPALTLKDREKWIDEVIEEYKANYGLDDDDQKPTKAQYKALDDQGVDVYLFHTKWLSMEIEAVITREIGNLVGTFFLMIFFLICAIALKTSASGMPEGFLPGRMVVSMLVVLQPVLAVLLAWGVGAIEMWSMGGDVDEDGKDDGVLALTVLSPLGVHLLLAIIVDYDIILVRAFDRMRPELSFEERLEHAAGYAHRSVLMSCLAIFVGYAFGSMVDVLALKHFAWHTAFGMLGLYITLFSLFLGGFVLVETYFPGGAKTDEKEKRASSGVEPKSIRSWSDKQVQQNMHSLTKTTDVDSMFSKIVGHKACIAVALCLEVALLIAGAVKFSDIKVEFNGKDYLNEDSRARQFLDVLEGMGGFSDYITLYLPPSSRGQYHKSANRAHFRSVIQQFMADEISSPIGVPGVFSWLEEFEMHHRGLRGDYSLSDPLSAATHLGCKACPLNLVMSGTNKRLPFAGNPMASIPLPTGTSVSAIQMYLSGAVPGQSLFTNVGKKGRSRFTLTGIDSNYVNSLLTGNGANVTDATARAQALTISYPQLAEVGGTGYEIAEIYDGGPLVDANGATMPPPMTESLENLNLIYSVDPVSSATDMSDFADMAALLADVATKAPGKWILFMLRDPHKEKYSNHNTFASERRTCPALHKSYFEQRQSYYETDENAFYDYLHSWYEEADPSSCCTSHMKQLRLQEKPDMTKPHISFWGRTEGENIIWDLANGAGDVKVAKGIRASVMRIACRAPLDPSKRVKAMKRLKKILTDARAARPDLWGSEKESFVVSSFFENSERDDKMLDSLTDYLFVVTLAATIMMMVFMHPYYGLLVGAFMLICNVQIVGLLALFDIKLDVIVLAVLVMAIGFEIEYCIHIVHSFCHQKSGATGLERCAYALQDMGVTVFTAFLSTAVQQLVLLIFATSLAFEQYPAMLLLVVIKSGMTGFVFAPGLMGVGDAVATMIIRKAKAERTSPQNAVDTSQVEMEQKADAGAGGAAEG